MKTKTTLAAGLVLYIFLFNAPALVAQRLWCPAFGGGASGEGTLIQMNTNGSGYTKLYDFIEYNGSYPNGTLVQADNGKVYGICMNGGPLWSCVIYSIDPVTNAYVMEWSFDGIKGTIPTSGLVKGPNGILYGVASTGGTSDAGVLYSYNTNTSVYTDLYDFTIYHNLYPSSDSVSGYAPFGSLLLASDGKLYGIASGYNVYSQTIHGFGNIYSYDINSKTYTKLYNFGGVKDGFGFGSLVEYNGVLYGMTSGRPQYARGIVDVSLHESIASMPAVNSGNIFSFNPATKVYSNLYSFDTTNGTTPYGSLMVGNDGKLYGVASAGGAYNLGVIFSFDPSSKTYTKLYDFDGILGATPMCDLTQSDGYLFGTTSAGGSNSSGVIFRFNPTTRDYTVLYSLEDSTGTTPLGAKFAVVNSTPAGILASGANQSFSVNPVPARNSINVSIEPDPGYAPLFTITDINGRVVWGPQTEPVNGNSQIRLDISSLQSGIYFLHAVTHDNMMVKKIIKE